jgi:hypothetical protein
LLFDREFLSGAIHVPAGEGIQRWVAGDMYSIKATAEQTAGTLGLVEAWVPPGAGPVAHVHNVGNEAFYILDGQLESLDGDRLSPRAPAISSTCRPAPGTVQEQVPAHGPNAVPVHARRPGGVRRRGRHEAVPGIPPPVWDMARFALIGEVTDNLGLDTDIFPEQ